MSHPVSLTAPQFANSPDPALDLARSPVPSVSRGFSSSIIWSRSGTPGARFWKERQRLGRLRPPPRPGSAPSSPGPSLRDPSITAGIATALAAIAPGRSVLGLGAGDSMSEDEAVRYGMDRPGLTERLGLLEETIELTRLAAPCLPDLGRRAAPAGEEDCRDSGRWMERVGGESR